ncbi:Arm DNA-binding domain-containing protein [Phyllobacterium sp. CCNWLW109]|uniref:Arm DNA-binding domain-containing protein n=1 Tax=Phyllobacterium sp. CCNWLW109 TaxID=3127479 RepID=UPI003076DED5
MAGCWHPQILLVYSGCFPEKANIGLDGYQQVPLTDTQIKAIKASDKPVKFSDGGGLHLLVTSQGSKLWRLAYRFDRKQKTLALGSYPITSLGDARKKRDAAKKLLASNIDPSQQAKLDKIHRQTSNATTFNAVADDFLKNNARNVKLDARPTIISFRFP